METLKTIFTRKSVRQFAEKRVPEETMRKILAAGMSGPSCVNARMWSFLVVRDRETLLKMAEVNGKAADPLKNADFGILVCGDMERAFTKALDYWIIDGSIAAQNMILAAWDLGVGSVWLGTYPQEEKVNGQAELFHLPKAIIPHSIIAFGYPASPAAEERDLFEEDRVHYEKW